MNFWMWCLAHRLELVIKDALCSTWFNRFNQMLCCLYYIYYKLPKKCSELESIVMDLKGAFNVNDERSGVRPIRVCGTQWVCHKLITMKWIQFKYGAYIAHLKTVSEDSLTS